MAALEKFARKWAHPDYPPERVDRASLAAAEKALGLSLPEDYKREILATGLPDPTMALLTGIVDRKVELHDLSSLLPPEHLVRVNRNPAGTGYPEHLLEIGGDCMGNSFAFARADLQNGPIESAPVHFWDHDYGTTERLADSFTGWIASYTAPWSEGLEYHSF
ncbi:MAG: SMI1/KNR4 family protein [Paracoccus denitrificans]|uniref:SMI1/KNR4 family protein n=1 Tax=Paracoccus denitrificans TaxID=266 RepID=A0A533I5T2_PARDE|nr:MAG: SMI1/KNR4 family protein [Paracoccus denitrificans]